MADDHHLQIAVEDIDHVFGKGYAKAHPELIAALLQAEAISRAAERISEASGELYGAPRSDHPLQAQTFTGLEVALDGIAEVIAEEDLSR